MADSDTSFIRLNGKHSAFVMSCSDGVPQIIYWGPMLAPNASVEFIRLLSLRDEAPASPREEVPLSLCPTLGAGFHGHPGLIVRNTSTGWSVEPKVISIHRETSQRVIIECEDSLKTLKLIHTIELDENDILRADSTVINLSQEDTDLQWCAPLTLPIDARCTHYTAFSGLWAGEFQTTTRSLIDHPYVKENRRGRTSHDSFPGLFLHSPSTTEEHGNCFGVHLAWSGNHKIHLERLSDGRSYLQMGELLLPGEIQLSPGEAYVSPQLVACFSADGFSTLSHHFHRFAIQKSQQHFKPAVGFNTWEARYFDHQPNDILALVHQAADLGCERFVLDDGWFLGRRSDRSGLGDWQVDETVYPEGLEPIIDEVKSLNMEFGLWIEPEMVNTDSFLYRAHPNWLLSTPENKAIEFRHQYVLDFSNPDVFTHIVTQIQNLLMRYDIAYLKWDMNRDLNQPGSSTDKSLPCVKKHVDAVYRMMKAIKSKFPKLQIESCASGGGRVDFGILDMAQRFWTSDATDAKDRVAIQRGYSFFFPLALMGSHVGPSPSPVTKRKLSMSFRAGVAFWGQMGCELDPGTLSTEEKAELKAAIALHKLMRPLLHEGRLHRLSESENAQRFGVVALDKSEGLFAHVQLDCCRNSVPPKFYFRGLDPSLDYQIKILWPLNLLDKNYAAFSSVKDKHISAELLQTVGLQLPRLEPESIIIFHLKNKSRSIL